jgi:hypothetical protein
MSDKDLFSDNLGDIDSILHNQGVSDLSWLVVNEEEYRKSEALPKQNLDIIPDLQKALVMDHEEGVPRLIPLKPHAIVNTNPVASKEVLSPSVPVGNRVASYVMSGLSNDQIKEKLLLEYPADLILKSASEISHLLDERGLIGNVYIDSKHFPKCSQEKESDRKFINACAKRSLFVISKPECSGCVKNVNGRCASLKRQIVDEVPYNSKLAGHYASQLAEENRSHHLADDTIPGWKNRLRMAFTAKAVPSNPESVQKVHTYLRTETPRVTESDIKEYVSRKAEHNEILSSDYRRLAKRMMDGYNDLELISNSTDPKVRRLASEYGLLGYTYLDMDVLGGCRNTIKFIESRGERPDYLIRRSASCGVCLNKPDGGCQKLCKTSKLVSSTPSLGVKDLISALDRALNRSVIDDGQYNNAMLRKASVVDYNRIISDLNLKQSSEVKKHYSQSSQTLFAGAHGGDIKKASLDPEEVRRFISHLMNTGLTGTNLQVAILSRYSKDDLKGLSDVGKRLASSESTQGYLYIDPTAYVDYGHGCKEGSSIFKNKEPRSILASSSCTGCTLQTAPGWCSRYCKSILRSVPSPVVRQSSKHHLPVLNTSIDNPVEKYQLSSDISVDLDGGKSKDVNIDLDFLGLGD